jgi:selenocysteine-specific elongation factor
MRNGNGNKGNKNEHQTSYQEHHHHLFFRYIFIIILSKDTILCTAGKITKTVSDKQTTTTMMSYSRFTIALTVLVAIAAVMMAPTADAFVAKAPLASSSSISQRSFALEPVHAKKVKEDLSYIETRDMTREEMLELNKKNEDIMNMELTAMTGFSLVLSLPILYLCWVAFFSD